MKKIGVLVPQSKTYPTLGKEFINGLKLNDSEEISFLIEGIGLGENVEMICEKMDKLVLQEDVHAIVGLFGDNRLAVAYEKVNSLEIPTVFGRLGAHQDIILENNKYAFTLSYGMCDALAFLGKWLVNNDFRNIGISGSFNDVGYGFVQTFEKSLYEAGGVFSGHYTPPLNPRPDEAEFLKEFYENVKSDAVCQLYNGVFAKENIEYLESVEGGIDTPLFFMPFALDNELLDRAAKVTRDLYALGSWLPVGLTGEPTSFDSNYYNAHGVYPSIVSLVGFLVKQAIEEVVDKKEELLKGGTIPMKNDALTGVWDENLRFSAPVKLWKAQTSESSTYLEVCDSSKDTNELKEPFEGQIKGWHNAYLCY